VGYNIRIREFNMVQFLRVCETDSTLWEDST
jgi:hypothetical protein